MYTIESDKATHFIVWKQILTTSFIKCSGKKHWGDTTANINVQNCRKQQNNGRLTLYIFIF